MGDIRDALSELRTALLTIKFFDAALSSLIIMSLALVVTTYAQLPWWYSLLPWAMAFTWKIFKHVNVDSYHEVEAKVPQLKEALTTAADTTSIDNSIVRELQQEVISKMRSVKTSYFLGFGKTTRQLLILMAMSFIVIGLSAFNVDFYTTKEFASKQKFLQDTMNFLSGNVSDQSAVDARLGKKKSEGELLYVKLKNNGTLFGDPFDVNLGDETLEMQVDPLNTGSNLKDVHDPENKNFRDQQAADITANAQGACGQDCTIPLESQDIVKAYFEKVGES